MNTPVPSAPVSPLHRALVEALESVATRSQAALLLRRALLAAGLDAVPDDVASFHAFVDGALAATLAQALGASSAEMVSEQAWHVVRLVAPAMRRQATGTGDDADELSGERSVETPSARGSGVGQARRKPEPVVRTGLSVPPPMPPLEAPVLFPPRSAPHESGTQRRRAAHGPTPGAPIARVTQPPTATGGVEESFGPPRSGTRVALAEVLVVTLDPRLVREVESELAGRVRVSAVVTLAELMTQLARIGAARLAIVLDTGVPSIDLPTFASIASALPASTRVVLWGTDERQKQRVVAMFPQAAPWVASGPAHSPLDLLGDET